MYKVGVFYSICDTGICDFPKWESEKSMLLKKSEGGVFMMRLQDTRIFTVVLITAMALIFAGCAAPPPPTTPADIQIVKNLQGAWASSSAKVSLTLKINGQEVTADHASLSPGRDQWDPTFKQRQGMDNNYTTTYDIIDGKIVFRSHATNHKLYFWLTGPDTMEGYRDDKPYDHWKMHRVVEK